MSIDALLANSQHIPAIPKVVQELIATFDQADVNVDAIADRIAMDQSLSAKVLRLANTPAYGGNRRIASVRDAVMILGFNAVRTLVLACGFLQAFKAPVSFDLRRFWLDTFRTATTCKWLAKFARTDPEVAFTAGLLHDIGSLLIHLSYPETIRPLDEAAYSGRKRLTLEASLFGFNYCDAGAALAQQWRFPDSIVQALKYQETPELAQPASTLAEIIHIAQFVLRQIDAGTNLAEIADALPDLPTQSLNINIDKVLNSLEEVPSLGSDIDAFLS